MSKYLAVKNSQIFHYLKTSLYLKCGDGKFILYKAPGTRVDPQRFKNDSSPNLYISEEERDCAVREVHDNLFSDLKNRITSGELQSVKKSLCMIVDEVFNSPIESDLKIFPDTVDIIYEKFSITSQLFKSFEEIQFGGFNLAEHSVNVMLLVLTFCTHNKLDESKTKKLSLSALLHDIGLTKLPKKLTGKEKKFTNDEFEKYKAHPLIGHDLLRDSKDVDSSICKGVLEHHERLDGNGYPRQITNISFEGRLIGLLDSFDSLTCTERKHRKKVNPFGALTIMQKEILKTGRYDRAIFRDTCLSLLNKENYAET